MTDERTRRTFLKGGLASVGVATFCSRSVAPTGNLSNELRIESDGVGVATYEFTVDGSLRQDDSGDRVEGGRAVGHVGPDRGVDSFSYSGEITGFVLAGPATAYRNGYRVRSASFPTPDGAFAADDFPRRSGAKRLRIESDGGGFAAYEFETSGSVGQRDSGDHLTGDHVYGHVGPDRGADEFEYTGDLIRFVLVGPASVTLDGTPVTPSSDGAGRTAVRASPPREVTATPDTTIVFEALACGYRGDYAGEAWYVDGERRYGPDAFYEHLGGAERRAFTWSFDSTGTHRVRAELYDEGKSTQAGAEPVGTVEWVVTVSSGGNERPTVERVEPSAKTITASRDSPAPVEFEVAASDPNGELDKVVWWLSQCDDVVAVSPVAGTSDTASISFAPEVGCPFGAWAIDEHGAMSELSWWNVEAE